MIGKSARNGFAYSCVPFYRIRIKFNRPTKSRKEPRQMQLDTTDLRILQVLQEDGRISNQDLAERVALSPSACLRRVRMLEEGGAITSIRTRRRQADGDSATRSAKSWLLMRPS